MASLVGLNVYSWWAFFGWRQCVPRVIHWDLLCCFIVLERFFLPGTLVHLVLIVQHIGVGLHRKELRLAAFSAGSESAVGPPQNQVQVPRLTAWWDTGHALELHSAFPLQNAVHIFDVVRVGTCDWICKRLTVVDSHVRDVWQLFQDRWVRSVAIRCDCGTWNVLQPSAHDAAHVSCGMCRCKCAVHLLHP